MAFQNQPANTTTIATTSI